MKAARHVAAAIAATAGEAVEPRFLIMRRAVAYTGRSRWWLARKVAAGELPASRVGNTFSFAREDLDRLMSGTPVSTTLIASTVLRTNKPLDLRGARRRVPVAASIARLREIGARGAGGSR